MDDTTRDPIIEAALNRYVPEAGWSADWNRVVARSAPQSRRVWLMGVAVVAVAGAAFALLAGASLRSESTAQRPMPPSGDAHSVTAVIVADDGRISFSSSVIDRIASGQETINRCLTDHGATSRVHGDGTTIVDDPGGRAHRACQRQIHEASAYSETDGYRLAQWSRVRAHTEMRACLARETGTIPTVKLGEPVSAAAAALRTCVAASRVAARSVTPGHVATTTASGTGAPPRPRTVDITIEGERVAIPETMTVDVDFTGSQSLGTVGGLRYVSATQRESGDPCFVSFAAGGGGTIGCDPRDQLVAKGGWLISLPDEGGTRRGLCIVPTVDGDLVFTTTPFEHRRPGSTITVRVGTNEVTRTIP